jgi:hypothetical protein
MAVYIWKYVYTVMQAVRLMYEQSTEGGWRMRLKGAVSDVVTGMIGGYVGTQVMERVSMKLYELEPEEDREQEEEVRPGPPFVIAARKITEGLGMDLSDEQLQMVAMYGFHYGLGVGWGPTYTFLRRWTDMGPVSAGLLSGAAMSLVVDEWMTPYFGFSAPNRDYPLSTHLRGFVAHLAFGLGVAATAEAIYWLGRNGGGGDEPSGSPKMSLSLELLR